MAKAKKQTKKIFHLTEDELQGLKDPDIEKRIDAILGSTWESARWYFNDNKGFYMDTISDDKKQIIGFKVHTINTSDAVSGGAPNEILKALNNPQPMENFEEFLKIERTLSRDIYRRVIKKPYM